MTNIDLVVIPVKTDFVLERHTPRVLSHAMKMTPYGRGRASRGAASMSGDAASHTEGASPGRDCFILFVEPSLASDSPMHCALKRSLALLLRPAIDAWHRGDESADSG